MSKYIPLPPPQDVESIPLYLQNELQKISNATEEKEEGSGCLGEASLTLNLGRTTRKVDSSRPYYKITQGGYGSTVKPLWAVSGNTTDSSLITYDVSSSTIQILKPCTYVATLDYEATPSVNVYDVKSNYEVGLDGVYEAIEHSSPAALSANIIKGGTVTTPSKSIRINLRDPYNNNTYPSTFSVGVTSITLNVRCYDV